MTERPEDLPIGGYAPGNYWNCCIHCGGTYRGHKSAVSCRGCAIAFVPAIPPATPAGDREVVPKISVQFETATPGAWIGTTAAPIKRIDREDDGTFTVVVDYWPMPAPPAEERAVVEPGAAGALEGDEK